MLNLKQVPPNVKMNLYRLITLGASLGLVIEIRQILRESIPPERFWESVSSIGVIVILIIWSMAKIVQLRSQASGNELLGSTKGLNPGPGTLTALLFALCVANGFLLFPLLKRPTLTYKPLYWITLAGVNMFLIVATYWKVWSGRQNK